MHKMRTQSEARELVVMDRVAVLPETGIVIPALFAPDAPTGKRVFEFFTAHIRNCHTREAYARAAAEFSAWCARRGIGHLRAVEPFHIAAYVEELQQRLAAPSVKQRLAALRMLFDWLVVGQAMPSNPASVVRGPKHSVKKGNTAVLVFLEVARSAVHPALIVGQDTIHRRLRQAVVYQH